jgi:hypothetical protein
MTYTIIKTLAAAHGALIGDITTSEDKALASTARKIEITMLDQLKKMDEKGRSDLLGEVMNSGSLKALKCIPQDARPPRNGYNRVLPNPDFILTQPAAYLREAEKRGFALGEDRRTDLLVGITKNPSNHARLQSEVMALSGPVSGWMIDITLKKVMALAPEQAQHIAVVTAKILKKGVKENPDFLKDTMERIACLHDPAAASDSYYPLFAIYALLGAKKPAKTLFEHEDIELLARTLLSPEGRKRLQSEMGSLEDLLAGGWRKPKGILAEYQAKRTRFRAPR